MNTEIPPYFDEIFLRWFQKKTENVWKSYQTATFEDYKIARIGGSSWQRGTRWLRGLSKQEITTIEQNFQVVFPPDYSLFLQILHSVDRPRAGARFDKGTMIPQIVPSFYHWQKDVESIHSMSQWITDGIVFDIQHNGLWPQSWGEKPDSLEEQILQLHRLIETAPKVIPIYGHRYLLIEPCQEGNPILSIYQSDIIIYGVNLHDYFLREFGGLIGIEYPHNPSMTREQYMEYQNIPFWGDFL